MNGPQKRVAAERLPLPVVCSDYDDDCRGLALGQARRCYEGDQKTVYPDGRRGPPPADGLCPILAAVLN